MIRYLPVVLLCLSFTAITPAFAQDHSNSTDTASIHGTVIDTRTSQPLNGATVALRSMQAQGRASAWSSATTSSDGTFTFRGLAAGRYRLSASHNGYADPSGSREALYGARPGAALISLGAGQTLDDVVIRLAPTGVISGKIINEREEPMAGVLVQALKSSYRDGRREFADARTAFSDDRGEFRVWGLAPGRYYVKATTPRSFDKGPVPAQAYVPVFYPGVIDPAQSQAIDLRPGDEFAGVNLTVNPLHAVHVRGRVLTSNGQPAKGAGVTLSQFGSNGYTVEGEADAAGKFDIAGVPSGSYTLEAQQSENSDSGRVLIGRSTISVGDINADVADVTVFSGAAVSGHVRLDGDGKVALARIRAALRPAAGSEGDEVGSTTVQQDGSFVFHDVPEGNYRVQLTSLPDGYYRKAPDGAAEAGVVVSHGHASAIEIRLDSGAGSVQGTVFKDKDNQEALPSATVVLVPDASRRSDSEYYRSAISDRSGRFVLRSVPPGDYLLFVFEELERDAYMDPEFIQQYEALGKPVRIEERSSQNLQLQPTIQMEDTSH
jgi:protocatechuate 3,4-dioxygenase beta subunit